LNAQTVGESVTFEEAALAARPPASAAREAALCAAAWGRLASSPGVDHDENVSIELRQLTRLRTTLEVASATALQTGPAGLLVYANARNSVRAALEGNPAAKEFELLFPRADASFSLSPEYPIVLLGQLIVWLRELEQSLAESVVSPELMLVDPELRRLATLAAEPPVEPEVAPVAEPAPDADTPPLYGPADVAHDERRKGFPASAGAYVLRASIRTAVIDLAFFVLLACIVLLISIR
jgi:hypothetical protein